jgi:3-oxoacyl-[acyl-carrier protein] reductase
MHERKLALITGGTSGIGKGIAEALAETHDLALGFNHRTDNALKAAEEIRTRYPSCTLRTFAKDLSNPEASGHLLSEVKDSFGRSPLIIVHSAGGLGEDSLLVKTPIARIIALLNTHLLAAMTLAKEGLGPMYESGWGRIILISSISAHQCVRGRPVEYAAAKSGIEGLTRALALEVAHRGITVNAIAPGLISTEMTAELRQNMAAKHLTPKDSVPVGFYGEPSDIGPMVKLLCSHEGRFITGQTITIDGGTSLGRGKKGP